MGKPPLPIRKLILPTGQAKSPSAKAIKHCEFSALNSSLNGESKSTLADYNIGKQIGQGAYAIVKEALQKSTNKKVAIKVYDKYRLLDPQRKKSVLNEIKILGKIDHKNIIKIYDTVDASKQLCLIMEYASGSSLHSFTKTKPNRRIPESDCKKIFKQVVSAIDYCHQRGICHRDIKMDNIIIDKVLGIKLIDFGFSTYSKDQLLKIYCGTPSYMSPEIVTKTPYNGIKADLWALGILLYVLLEGAYPFKASSDKDLYRKISKGQYPAPDGISQNAIKLISKLLVIDPNKRVSTDKLLGDAFFSNEDDEKRKKVNELYGKDTVDKLVYD
jgi:MAP/microtubule affinity-regulating kinase